jgi:hypothetical protein
MRRQLIALTLAAAAAWLTTSAPSIAQQPVAPCVTTTSSSTGVPITSCQPVSAANPLPTTGGGGGGGAVTQATVPWVDNVTQWASGTLGAMANYGTSPGAVLAPGVNAFVTNTITATILAGSAVIGHVIVDSGTITAVNAITNALPAGTNVIGAVGNTQASTTSGQSGPLIQCAVTTGAPTYTTAQTDPLSCDTSGNLRTTATIAANSSVNVAQFGGNNVVTGTGASGSGIPRVTLSNDSSLAANQSVNLAQVAGATTAVGHGTAAGALRVELPTDGTGLVLANPGTAANWGVGATGAAVPANGPYVAGQARSSEPTSATNGNLTGASVDLVGKQITSPYANRENYVRGSASSTSNTAVTIIASAGGSLKNYITDVECGRSDAGTAAIIVTFNDSASTILVLPNSGGGGGNNKTFNVPLATAAATAFQFTPGTSTTTVYCSAQGYTGY